MHAKVVPKGVPVSHGLFQSRQTPKAAPTRIRLSIFGPVCFSFSTGCNPTCVRELETESLVPFFAVFLSGISSFSVSVETPAGGEKRGERGGGGGELEEEIGEIPAVGAVLLLGRGT